MRFKPLDSTYNTVLVPSLIGGLENVFLKEHKWPKIRLREDRVQFIEYIAIYVSSPVSAITHYAKIKNVEKDNEFFVFHFHDPIQLNPSIPFVKGKKGLVPQSLRLIKFDQLKLKTVNEILAKKS